MFISRGRNTGIHHHKEVISVGESSKEKFFKFKILSSDLRDILLHFTIVTNSARSCISIIVKESVLIHMRSNMTMFYMLLIIVCLSEVY